MYGLKNGGIGSLVTAQAYLFDNRITLDMIELSMRANHGLAHLEGARRIRFAWL
jgi:hypothetical protein